MAFEFEYKDTFVSPKGAMIKGPKIKLEKKKKRKKKIYAYWLFPVIVTEPHICLKKKIFF